VVAILLADKLLTTFAPRLREAIKSRELDRLGLEVEVREIPWDDTAESRRAKSGRSRSPAWLRSHETPLDAGALAALEVADVVVAFEAPIDFPALAPRVRFVQGIAAGVNPLVGVLRGTNLRVCSAVGLSAPKVAEFALARLLGVWIDQRTIETLQRGRRWAPDAVDATPIAGRTVLVVGTGGIGQAFARRAVSFDLRVLGVRRRPELGRPEGFDRVVGVGQLHDVLPEADAVLVAAPATERTSGLIGKEELAAMKRGAVLCNVARGSLVDEDALLATLISGHLGAAVIDVVAHEPLSRSSPLWRAPNMYLSPHVANAWRPEYFEVLVELLLDNIVRDAAGESLLNEVDLDEGY